MADEENVIKCPTCNENTGTHMVKTWMVGNKSFELDGTNVLQNSPPIYFQRCGSRGSSMIILFVTERCDHMWIEETYFHKGNTYRYHTMFTAEQVSRFGKNSVLNNAMWRD